MIGQVAPANRKPCRHDSMRRDSALDDHCLLCGADGYWHNGHRHDRAHPGGKALIDLTCPDAPERASDEKQKRPDA